MSNNLFKEAIETILRDGCTPAAIRAIEQGGSATSLWDALAGAGYLELMAPEAADGAGLGLDAVFPIFVAFGRFALPVPAAQSIAARALLRDTGVHAPAGMITLAGNCRRAEDGSLVAPMTAFGTITDHVLAQCDGALLLLDASRARRVPTGVAGSQRATLRWSVDERIEPIADGGAEVLNFSAAIHAAAIAGAMKRVFGMTLDYCNDRIQFGKPIGKFQAVQHQLAVMAEQVAAAGIAAEAAFTGPDAVPAPMATAIAKSQTSMAVPSIAAAAHALHGAIGITQEFDLQLYTRRLHEWRMADGSETYWNRIVGQAVLAQSLSATDFVRRNPTMIKETLA